MLLKYKLQLLIIPLVILPVLFSTWFFIDNTRSSIIQLQSEVMAYRLNVVEDNFMTEYSVLERLKLTESTFYVQNAKERMIEFARSVEIPGGYIFIVDDKRELISHPEIETINESQWDELSTLVGDMNLENSEWGNHYTWEEAEYLAFKTDIDQWGWVIVATAKEEIIYQSINTSTGMAIGISLLSVGVIVLLILVISRSITKPIEKLANGAKLMSEGDRGIRVSIDTGDEFEILAKGFNKMAEEVDKSFLKIEKQVSDIEEISMKIRDREQLFRGLFDNTVQMSVIIKTDGIVTEVNDKALQYIEIESHEIINQKFWSTPWWQSADEMGRKLLDSINDSVNGIGSQFEAHTITKDGKSLDIDFSIKPIFNEDKELLVIILEGRDISKIKLTERKMKEFNDDLENRVNLRTKLLRKSNSEFEESLCDLEETQEELLATKQELEESVDMIQRAQKQLVETEKLAALGALVAGISHEMNTPIGMGVTSASYLKAEVENLETLYNNHELKKSNLEEFISKFKEGSDITLKNLVRASELITGFKMIAVDQSSHKRRVFELKGYIKEIIRTLTPEIKRTSHTIDINCADKIMLDSYPGAVSQILSNLIMNSVVHGFENVEKGHIMIDVEASEEEVILTYCDDGKGIQSEHIKRIFEPFFTTKLGRGGSGLGLHIVFNLATSILNGRIVLDESVKTGTKFVLTVPLVVSEKSEVL